MGTSDELEQIAKEFIPGNAPSTLPAGPLAGSGIELPVFEGGTEPLHTEALDSDPAISGGYLQIVGALRRQMSKSDRVGPISDVIARTIPPSVMSAERLAVVQAVIAKHLAEFPEEPKAGFETAEAYLTYDWQINKIVAAEKYIYNQKSVDFHPEDPEVPGEKMCSVSIFCADGRICRANFLAKKDLFSRFATRELPAAGLVIVPEVNNGLSSEEIDQLLYFNPQLEKMIFERFDHSLAAKVNNFLIKKNNNNSGTFSRLHFEFQSHYEEKSFPDHGCGAHKSNFDQAQAETIKNCMLVDKWLQYRYPEEYALGWFRIYRTAHDTGTGGNIYTASKLDKEKVSKRFYQEHQTMFEEAESKYFSPKIEGLPDGMFKIYQENHMNIDEERHTEQVIRISDTHLAHTLLGQSVLEISWTDSPENLYNHLLLLLEIIEKNFRQEGKNSKPAILHFDLLKGRPDLVQVYFGVLEKINENPTLSARLDDGTLKIVTTETNPHDYISNRVEPQKAVFDTNSASIV